MGTKVGTSGYQSLLVWQKSMALVEEIYLWTSSVTPDERFGIVSQLKRSSVSVPINIAEGNARPGGKEARHFVDIARGSVAETETLIILIQRLGLAADGDQLLRDCYELGKMLGGLRKSIVARQDPTI